MKDRLYSTVKKYAVVLAIGIAYLIFMLCVGGGIPCIFYVVTGLKCPACGVSRMIMSLARLDLAAAFDYNPYLLINSPIILFCVIYPDVKYVRCGDRSLGRLSIVLWIEIGMALVYGVLRNLL